MSNLIIIVLLTGLIGLAVYTIVENKKKGARCLGCPSAGSCPHCAHKK